MNKQAFIDYLDGKQHPFDVGALQASLSLYSYVAALPFEQNEQLLWLIKQIDDPVLRQQLSTEFVDGMDHMHESQSLFMARYMLGPVTSADLTAAKNDFEPQKLRMWAKIKENVGAKVLYYWNNRR
jgi:hypothetical protein